MIFEPLKPVFLALASRPFLAMARLAGLLLVAAATATGAASATLDAPLVLTQAPVARRAAQDKALTTGTRANGFEGARVVVVSPDGQLKVLSSGFHSACDPDVSLDGRKVLFAGKKEAGDPWAVWEIGIDGASPRAITSEKRDCRGPIYLGSLFTLDSPEPWFTVLFAATENSLQEQGEGFATSLYSVKLDGTEPRRLTFNPNRGFDAVQMWDGRVLYASVRSLLETGPDRRQVSLFSIHIDGTDHELYGAEQGKRIQRMPCSLANGRVVFVESDAPAWDGAGQLAWVREQRPHHSYEPLTVDGQVAWLYPSPLTEQTILVSRRPADSRGGSGVFCFDTATRRAEPVFDSPDYDDLQAKIARARPVPDGRSTVVDTKYNTGKLYGLNCYAANPKLQPDLPPGAIQRLRLLEAVPAAGEGGASTGEAGSSLGHRLLGEAPVDPDGSFHIEIPADVPVQLQALDSNGLALATCDWIWVKQKENRGCIGCHEDPELLPENVFVSALARPANRLTLPAKLRRSVAFREQVAPILRNKCGVSDCHAGPDTPLRLALGNEQDARKTYAALLAAGQLRQRPYVVPGRARASFLAWQLLGRAGEVQSSKPERQVKQMPPPGKAEPLTREELRLLLEWIDMGAQWETPKSTEAAGETPLKAPHENDTH